MHDVLRITAPTSVRQGGWQGALPAVLIGRDALLGEQFQSEGHWGVDTAIDLFDCDPVAIRDAPTIKAFTLALCDQIAMRRYGDPRLVHFGQDERVSGFSLSQFIETSDISAHFINQSNAVCLNIFSCKMYPPYQAAAFCQEWFRAQACQLTVTFRGPLAGRG